MALETIIEAVISVLVLLISLSFHEAAHAYAAMQQGDDTAKLAGRLTLNPIAHIDPIGTIILPLVLKYVGGIMFGWAKPVPVNPNKFKSPQWGYVWVAFAGPLSNLILSALSIILILLYKKFALPFAEINQLTHSSIIHFLSSLMIINIFLACFNLIPLSPLDGSAILTAFLPNKMNYHYAKYIAPYGMLIIITLLYAGGLDWIKFVAFAYIRLMSSIFAIFI